VVSRAAAYPPSRAPETGRADLPSPAEAGFTKAGAPMKWVHIEDGWY
jgi:hypothetical protein